MSDRDRREEINNGGLVSREGSIVTLGNGAQWWLIGDRWAANEADALIRRNRQDPIPMMRAT